MNASRKLAALGAAFALAALAVALIAAPATATRTVRIRSQLSIAKSKSFKFSGKVTAGNEACLGQRKVVLYKVVGGGPDQAVGRTTTSNKGAWSITPQGWAGISLTSFYAKVKAESQGTAGTIYVCRAARSRTVKPSA